MATGKTGFSVDAIKHAAGRRNIMTLCGCVWIPACACRKWAAAAAGMRADGGGVSAQASAADRGKTWGWERSPSAVGYKGMTPISPGVNY